MARLPRLRAMTDRPETTRPASSHGAWGIGIATVTGDGTVLDTWFPTPNLDPDMALVSQLGIADGGSVEVDEGQAEQMLGVAGGDLLGPDPVRGVTRALVVTHVPDLDAPPVDTCDAYLR